jgi:tetratricopeptide (TPR) repeat protein
MDGRRIRRWFLSASLAALAVGCNRNEVRAPWDTPAAQPVTGMPMATAKKSFWGGSGAQPPGPVEVVPEPAKEGPPGPEAEAAFADLRLDLAFDEKQPPANREALLDMARLGYQKALQQDPKNKTALLGLARFYTRVGDREKAVEGFKKYLTLYPQDREVAHEVARAHAQWKDWAGAVAWCDFALQLDPENLNVRKTKAFCLARGGKWEQGLDVMMQVMPEAQARYLIARALEHQNHPDACRQQLQLALRADPNYPDAREFLDELNGALKPGGPGDPNGLRQAGHTEQP